MHGWGQLPDGRRLQGVMPIITNHDFGFALYGTAEPGHPEPGHPGAYEGHMMVLAEGNIYYRVAFFFCIALEL